MKAKNKLLYLGTTGFPFGTATVQRQIQISKALLESGFQVTVINRRSTHSKKIAKREKLSIFGSYLRIKYIYASLITYKPTNFFSRNIFKALGLIIEFLLLFYYRIFKRFKFLLVRANDINNLKYYFYVSRILGLKLIYDYVEFYDSLGERKTKKVNELDKSFDYDFHKFADKIIVISAFLEDHLKKISPLKPYIKIPPIIDFSYFDGVQVKVKEYPFFLFCGSANYDDVIEFIVEAFIISKSIQHDYHLKLVINGSPNQLTKLEKYLNNKGVDKNVHILTSLAYNELISNYKASNAVLIPIGDNVQDKARFPFKICEYTASKRPIITSDSGAILEFFENNVNALIAKTNEINDFANKLNIIIDSPNIGDNIGLSGYELGKNVFNFQSYSKSLKYFLTE